MFDEHQSRLPALSLTPALVIIACAGGGILLSFGLCGVNLINGDRAAVGIAVPYLARAGVILFGLSVIAILIGAVWLLVIGIINAIRR